MDKHAKKSEARRVPCERHLGLTDPITTSMQFSQGFKTQIINYKHIYTRTINEEDP